MIVWMDMYKHQDEISRRHFRVEIDEETDEEIVKKATRQVGMLFVRGDIVVLVSPPLRTA